MRINTGQPIPQKGQRGKPKTHRHPLRENARGQNCTLRLDCCNHDPATVVFAHYRFFSWAGTAQKPDDLLGCFACSNCHDAIDGRGKASFGYDDLLRAMGETLMIQHRDGVITT